MTDKIESRNVPLDPHGKAAEQMTLRVQLAAMMAQGLLAQHMTQETESGNRDFEPVYLNRLECTDKISDRAVLIADAMIARLNLPCVTITATVMPKEGGQ